MEAKGIKEAKELLEVVGALSALLISVLKDGAQISDIPTVVTQIIANPGLKDALEVAIKGVNEVPAEVKDISFPEGMELVGVMYAQVQKCLAAAKQA